MYDIGDKVVIAHDPYKEGWEDSCVGGVNTDMRHRIGDSRVYTIREVERRHGRIVYYLAGMLYVWDERWFERAYIDEFAVTCKQIFGCYPHEGAISNALEEVYRRSK